MHDLIAFPARRLAAGPDPLFSTVYNALCALCAFRMAATRPDAPVLSYGEYESVGVALDALRRIATGVLASLGPGAGGFDPTPTVRCQPPEIAASLACDALERLLEVLPAARAVGAVAEGDRDALERCASIASRVETEPAPLGAGA